MNEFPTSHINQEMMNDASQSLLASDSATDELVRPRGSNHGGMRQFNERIVLQSIRLHGALPKADVARMTHLSTQTASVIINKLLAEGLLQRQDRLRGKIGQPSIPIGLNPDGAFSVGIKIGRRGLHVLALDFAGNVRHRELLAYESPEPEQVFEAITHCFSQIQAVLGKELSEKMVGVGVAAPLHLDGWTELLGGSEQEKRAKLWNHVDIVQRVHEITGLPVEFAKDTTAACVAELVSGQGRSLPTFLYFYIGTFIGGGLVIDSHLYPGQTGNAGALGSFPLGLANGNSPYQLLSKASGISLENALQNAGYPAGAAHDERALESKAFPHTQAWLDEACPAIAMAIVSSTALLELDGVIIDGTLDRKLLGLIIEGVKQALGRYNLEGLHLPSIKNGTIGREAKAMGGALLPLYAHFAPDRAIFLKQAPV